MTQTGRLLKKRKRIRWAKIIPIYFIMLPGIAYLIINNFMPLYGITIAFRKLDFAKGVFRSPFNGFDNFEFLFSSGILWPILRNTLLYNLVFIVLGIVVPVVCAILFNTIINKSAKKFFQTSVLLPNLMSWVIVSYIVFAFLSSDSGFINKSIIEPLTGKSVQFYNEPKYWPVILTIVNQWKALGFGLIIYLASLLGIDPGLYEAAKLDGANFLQRTFKITLPCLKPTIITLFVLSLSKICISDFGLFFQVTKNSGPLYPTTQTLDTYVYVALMKQPNITLSSAVSVLQSIVGFVLVIIANLVLRKVDKDNAFF